MVDCCEVHADCDDENYCTEDLCIESSCTHVDNSRACDDGEACTEGDSCANGVCTGTILLCDDGNDCTADSCSGGECLNVYAPTVDCCSFHADCDDGDRCTLDRCKSKGECSNTPIDGCCNNDPGCDDGDTCTVESCVPPNSAAVRLNGVNEHVTMGRAMDLGLTVFTIECWFKWDGGGTAVATSGYEFDHTDRDGIVAYPLVTRGLVDNEYETHKQVNFFLGISESTQVLEADFEEHSSGSWRGENHAVSGVTPIVPGVWHHAAAAYDGICWQLYLDGQPETDGTNCPAEPPAYESQAHLALGTAQDFNGGVHGRFQGLIDEVRIWERALSGSEIQAGMYEQLDPNPGLVGRWSLNQSSGFVSADSSGFGHDAVLVHATLDSQDVVDMGGSVCEVTQLIPAEVEGFTVISMSPTELIWDGQTAETAFDIVTGTLSDLRADGLLDGAICLADAVSGTVTEDPRPDPAPGDGHYYFLRAETACDVGTYGFTSDGAERLPSNSCP